MYRITEATSVRAAFSRHPGFGGLRSIVCTAYRLRASAPSEQQQAKCSRAFELRLVRRSGGGFDDLQGIESATGKDIAGMIIEHIEKNAVPARKAPPKPKG